MCLKLTKCEERNKMRKNFIFKRCILLQLLCLCLGQPLSKNQTNSFFFRSNTFFCLLIMTRGIWPHGLAIPRPKEAKEQQKFAFNRFLKSLPLLVVKSSTLLHEKGQKVN